MLPPVPSGSLSRALTCTISHSIWLASVFLIRYQRIYRIIFLSCLGCCSFYRMRCSTLPMSHMVTTYIYICMCVWASFLLTMVSDRFDRGYDSSQSDSQDVKMMMKKKKDICVFYIKRSKNQRSRKASSTVCQCTHAGMRTKLKKKKYSVSFFLLLMMRRLLMMRCTEMLHSMNSINLRMGFNETNAHTHTNTEEVGEVPW